VIQTQSKPPKEWMVGWKMQENHSRKS
jgi:hypothetical protein